ncbi:MAG: flippase-like domain-containing protein [Desulfovibrio sp.]|jgi:uncharacterized membrane protein YbhN (UPF0104 family)|nr:flippase-like domain-containing protein [Desulfovibrio sp.]
MTSARGKTVKVLAVAAVPAACFWYLFHNLDVQRFSAAFGALPAYAFAAACLLFGTTALLQGLRLYYILEKRCALSQAVRACFLCSGVNTLLPARLGDVVKSVSLSVNCAISIPATLCAVFWERLSDLLAVLLLAVGVGLYFDAPELYMPTLALPLALIAGLILVRRFRPFFHKCVSLLPNAAPRAQLDAVILRLAGEQYRPSSLLLSALTLPVWTGFCIFNSLFFAYFHNTAPDLFTGLLLTTAGAVGVMLPGTPGGIGTFEASVVAALSLVNMDKSEALAFALVLHLVQVIPAVLYAAYAALRGQWSLSGVRSSLPAAEEAETGAGAETTQCSGNTTADGP